MRIYNIFYILALSVSSLSYATAERESDLEGTPTSNGRSSPQQIDLVIPTDEGDKVEQAFKNSIDGGWSAAFLQSNECIVPLHSSLGGMVAEFIKVDLDRLMAAAYFAQPESSQQDRDYAQRVFRGVMLDKTANISERLRVAKYYTPHLGQDFRAQAEAVFRKVILDEEANLSDRLEAANLMLSGSSQQDQDQAETIIKRTMSDETANIPNRLKAAKFFMKPESSQQDRDQAETTIKGVMSDGTANLSDRLEAANIMLSGSSQQDREQAKTAIRGILWDENISSSIRLTAIESLRGQELGPEDQTVSENICTETMLNSEEDLVERLRAAISLRVELPEGTQTENEVCDFIRDAMLDESGESLSRVIAASHFVYSARPNPQDKNTAEEVLRKVMLGFRVR